MAVRINAEGQATIKRFEGLRLKAYRDQGGVLTIGWGHTGSDVQEGTSITEAKAEQLFQDDLATAEAILERTVDVELTEWQWAALVSFVFNVGAGRRKGIRTCRGKFSRNFLRYYGSSGRLYKNRRCSANSVCCKGSSMAEISQNRTTRVGKVLRD